MGTQARQEWIVEHEFRGEWMCVGIMLQNVIESHARLPQLSGTFVHARTGINENDLN